MWMWLMQIFGSIFGSARAPGEKIEHRDPDVKRALPSPSRGDPVIDDPSALAGARRRGRLDELGQHYAYVHHRVMKSGDLRAVYIYLTWELEKRNLDFLIDASLEEFTVEFKERVGRFLDIEGRRGNVKRLFTPPPEESCMYRIFRILELTDREHKEAEVLTTDIGGLRFHAYLGQIAWVTEMEPNAA